ncbi:MULTISPECIES: glycosyltransferase [Parapedobacter]|nr:MULTISPECIES: glycosyltransferase [Parapedobacter]
MQLLVGVHLVAPILLYLLYVTITRMRRSPMSGGAAVTETDYAIIVTAYGQVDSLPAVIDSILKLRYNRFMVYVVADNCDCSALDIKDERIVLLQPEQVLASNTRSHFYAIDRFRRPHERLTIIDSDNLVHPDYLRELDQWFNRGFVAVQGIRKPKNLDTTLACLDAARDSYYHYYDGALLFGVGSSATLAGSGMAFTTELYKQCLGNLDITGAGFDKVLQYELVKRRYRIAFAPSAIVYDEKTAQATQLVNQRARWINTWFKYMGFGFRLLASGLRKLDVNQVLFGLTLLRPPLFIFLLGALFFLMVDLLVYPLHAAFWLVGLSLFVVAFLNALWHSKLDRRVYRSLWRIPRFMALQLVSLFKARKANKISVATQHSVVKQITEIENLTEK